MTTLMVCSNISVNVTLILENGIGIQMAKWPGLQIPAGKQARPKNKWTEMINQISLTGRIILARAQVYSLHCTTTLHFLLVVAQLMSIFGKDNLQFLPAFCIT